jgi:7,8-dihydroneopterin aldolase/epimerase/oxygenase
MRSDFPSETGSAYCIVIDRLRLNMLIGVCDFERLKTQPVEVSLRVFTNAEPASVATSDYVSYADIVNIIERETEKHGHIDLVEHYADLIAEWVLRDNRILRVRVEVIKTAILPRTAGVGVIIERSN